jgi:hypothetical protein
MAGPLCPAAQHPSLLRPPGCGRLRRHDPGAREGGTARASRRHSARLLRWQGDSPAKVVTPPCSRACWRERACARPRMAGPGSVSDDPARGMRIRAGVAPAAARLESPGYRPDCDFAYAISDPEPSPQRHRDVRKAVVCERSAITRPGSIEASPHLRPCSASLLRAVTHWDFVWDLGAFPWRVATHFHGLALRHK